MTGFRHVIWGAGWLFTVVGVSMGVTSGCLLAASKWNPHEIHAFAGFISASLILLVGAAIASSLARVDL